MDGDRFCAIAIALATAMREARALRIPAIAQSLLGNLRSRAGRRKAEAATRSERQRAMRCPGELKTEARAPQRAPASEDKRGSGKPAGSRERSGGIPRGAA
jgi:hypothetical protein